MKQIELSQGYFAQVSDEDYVRVSVHNWHADIKRYPSGAVRTIYAMRHTTRLDGRRTTQYLHDFILGCVRADHKDHNGLNNQRGNLRVATESQNQHNRGASKNNTSGFKGVHWDKKNKKWHAQIGTNNKKKSLGRFTSAEQAAHAYDAAAVIYHGEFANLNFN